jgi:hypothetical protein
MISTKLRAGCVALVFVAIGFAAPATFSQDSSQPRLSPSPQREDDTNVETQLYLISATNRDAEDGRMPLGFEAITLRLRERLPFKHYAVAATFINRARHNARVEMTWIGGPLLAPAFSPMGNPSFNQFTAVVRLATDAGGRQIVRMNDFKLGVRIPTISAQTNSTATGANPTSFPTISYESVGLRTDISMAEGVPVIVGTLNVGPSGDAIVVVMLARRVSN